MDRIANYIQSLPDVAPESSPTTDRRQGNFFDNGLTEEEEEEVLASPAAPPPPAPPDPGPKRDEVDDDDEDRLNESEPTTGEKIFKALRAVTSHSYIDANEFYK